MSYSYDLRQLLFVFFITDVLLRNKGGNQNKCKDNNMSNKVHAFPRCQAWLKLKQHKSAAEIFHGTIMEKPAQPVIPVTQFWRQVWLDGFLHSHFSNNNQRNHQEGEIITRGNAMPEGTHKKSDENSRQKGMF